MVILVYCKLAGDGSSMVHVYCPGSGTVHVYWPGSLVQYMCTGLDL